MKKLVFSLVCALAVVGFVMADEFNANITKVDGSNVTFKKGGGGGGKGGKGGKGGGGADVKEEKADATGDVKVKFATKAGGGKGGKGGKGGGGGMVEIGEDVPMGLKNEMFSKIVVDDTNKGVGVQITTNDAGKITQVLVYKKKGG